MGNTEPYLFTLVAQSLHLEIIEGFAGAGSLPDEDPVSKSSVGEGAVKF